MKNTLIAATLFAASFAASAQLAYPGSNWSALTVNPSVIKGTPEDNNVLLQGKLEQGVVWVKFGDNWRVNTYGSVGYSWDRNGLSYNNKVVPAIGVKLQRSFDSGIFDVGVELAHQNNFRGVTSGPKSGTGVLAYAQYWFGWDLKK